MVVGKNIIANYIGQFYVAFVGILTSPLCLNFLGAESYGLIGFFALLQALMQLLEMGMSPAFSREVARSRGIEHSGERLRGLLRCLEVVFAAVALVMAVGIVSSRFWLAEHWFTFEELGVDLVGRCIALMGLAVAIRWYASLYRGGVQGYERHVWLSVINILTASLRFPVSLFLVWLYSADILTFFICQIFVSAVEVAILAFKMYAQLPKTKNKIPLFSINVVKPVLPFALSIAYTAGIWVFVTQLDRLLLSKVLSLTEYGYFTLVATVTSGFLLLSSPISKVMLPRMTLLLAQGQEVQALNLYCESTRVVASVIAPVTLMLAMFPEAIIYVWTGDREAARWASDILPLYSLGSGLLAIGAFQYYLQYAHGKMRLHVQYNSFSAVLSVPLIFYAAFNYGPVGVGYLWLVFRFLSLLIWTPYIHKVLAPGLHVRWVLRDVLPSVIVSTILFLVTKRVFFSYVGNDRFLGLVAFICLYSISILISLSVSFNQRLMAFAYAKIRL